MSQSIPDDYACESNDRVNGNNNSDCSYKHVKETEDVYVKILILNLAITIFITALSTMIIWKRSTNEMKYYKWCLLNILFTSFSFEALLTLWVPVPIFPIYGAYNGGVLKNVGYTEDNVDYFNLNYFFLMLALMIFVNLMLSYANFLLYQIVHLKPGFWINHIIADKKAYFGFYLGLFVTLAIIISVPIWIGRGDDFTPESEILKEFPTLVTLVQRENCFGFSEKSRIPIYILITLIIVFFILYFLTVIILNFLAIRALKETKMFTTSRVHAMQRTLYKSFIMQSLTSFAIFFAPPLLIVVHHLAPVDYRFRLGMFTVIIFSFHAPISSAMTILTITPYRSYLLRVLWLRKEEVNTSKVVPVSTVQAPKL